MATIKISDLQPAGAKLFQDSESFLNELTEQEFGDIKGGRVRLFWSMIDISGRNCACQ